MNNRIIVAAIFSVAATVMLAIEVLSWPSSARFGPVVAPSARCAQIIVSAADSPGLVLRAGDAIQLPAMSFNARLAVAYRYLPMQTGRAGDTIGVVFQRDGVRGTISYPLRHTDSLLSFLGQLGFKLFILVVGLVVLWRGKDRASLTLGAWCLGVLIILPDAWWGLAPPAARFAGSIVNASLWTALPFVLYLVVESFVVGVSTRTKWIARTAVGATVAPALFDNSVNIAAQVSSGCALVALPHSLINDLFPITQLTIMAFFILYYLDSSGLVRQRLRWVFWSFLISRFGVLLNLFNRTVAHPLHLSGLEWITVGIFPLGCAYAILRHRIIDVNFVLNRTLIYTILTSFAVGVFIVLEELLRHLTVSRGVGLAVELAVALALGFSFNALHRRVETAIDRLLFRRKYEAAQELQQLADEAAYMESADALLTRAVHEIPKAVDATGAAVYERVGEGYKRVLASGSLGLPDNAVVDDQAFVRLRMHMQGLYLSDVNSALGVQGIAFPLAIRGQLFGAFICGPRVDGEIYAPDEVRTLGRVTHELGAELFAMRMRRHQELLESVLRGSIDLSTAQKHFQATVWPQAAESEQKPQPATG